MIAAICLAFALFFTYLATVSAAMAIRYRSNTLPLRHCIIACLLWGLYTLI